MKINDLKDSFDCISPTQEQKERMFSKILEAENKKTARVFDFKKIGGFAVGLAAVIALSVAVYNTDDFNTNNNDTRVATVVDEKVETVEPEIPEAKAEEPSSKKVTETKKPKVKKRTEVAKANPLAEPEAPRSVTESAPVVSGGGGGGTRMTESPIQGRLRTVDGESDETAEDTQNENSGIAVASKINEAAAVTENETLDAENVPDTQDDKEDEDEEETENEE